jgi:prepilin-type N-terminal cleavage/methylation domain-containing protein
MRLRLRRFLFSAWRGFTLIEVVVALAVILVLAAVAVPALTGFLDQKAVEASATQLATVRDALYNTAGGAIAFRQKVGKNAGRLSQLSDPIVASDPNYLDACNAQYKNAQVTNWNNNGPFVNFDIDRAAGMGSPIGTADDFLLKNAVGAPAGNTLRIRFLNAVELGQADLLDQLVDASNGNAVGIVQWVLPAVDGKVTLYYFVMIDATC